MQSKLKKGYTTKYSKLILILSIWLGLSSVATAATVNMAPIISYLLSDTSTDTTLPVFTSSESVTVAENQTDAITLVATGLSSVSYSIVENNTSNLQVDESTGKVTFITAPDYETLTRYSFTATATDEDNNSADQNVTINISNVAETVATLSAFNASITENISGDDTEGGTIVGTISVDDSGDTDITSFTLSGTSASDFSIDADGVITTTTTLDYDVTPIYNLTVVATNDAGDSISVSVVIEVKNYLNPFQIAKLTATDGVDYAKFGDAVAIDGDYILIGAYKDDTNVTGSGSAYLYKKYSDTHITLVAKIQPTMPEASAYFGYAVAIEDDYIVIGAYKDDTAGTDAGSVYLFSKDANDTVTQLSKFQADDAEGGDYFGYSLGISGSYITVGAYKEDTSYSNAGSAYVYTIGTDSSIAQLAKLQSNIPEENAYFGKSVAIADDYIAIGAYREDTQASDAGSAYIFKRNSDSNISQLATLQADDVAADADFGRSIAIEDDYIVVGAYGDNDDTGSAYVFKRNDDTSFTQIAKLEAEDGSVDDRFGRSVAMDGNYIVVGAYEDDVSYTDEGSAYIFEKESDDTFSQIKKMQAYDAEEDDFFANSVAISGNDIIIGTPEKNINSVSEAGAAYLISLDPQDSIYFYEGTAIDVNYSESLTNTNEVYIFNGVTPNNDTISYSIGGDDSGSFIMEDNALFYAAVEDYENPSDSDMDNNYNLSILATSSSGITQTLSMNIALEDSFLFTIADLQADDATTGTGLGDSLAIDGDYFVAGADESVYLFKKNSNDYNDVTQIAKLESNDAQSGDNFGSSVSIDGNYIVVGAYTWDHNSSMTGSGSAYVFKRESDTSVVQIAKLEDTTPNKEDYFGISVSISGEYIVVGSYLDDTTHTSAGSVFMYKIVSDSNVTELSEIQPEDIQGSDYFGSSVAMNGDYIVAGAPKEDTNATDAGSAYVFQRISDTNITQIAKIQASNPTDSARFGTSVAIDNKYIVVGARYGNGDINGTGSAYLFKRNSDTDISQISQLIATDSQESDYFGSTVAISGDYITIGAPFNTSKGNYAGSAYLFKRNSDATDDAQQVSILTDDTTTAFDYYGTSVAIDGNTVLVGAPLTDTVADGAGSVYVYLKDDNQP